MLFRSRVTTSFYRALLAAADKHRAGVALIDVGPNLGAINRAALLSADFVVVPIAADLFSLQGLENVGPKLRDWHKEWRDRRDRAPEGSGSVPSGEMRPVGSVMSRYSVFAGGPVKAYQRWLERVPGAFRRATGVSANDPPDMDHDPFCLATLKDYRSLMPMAQAAKRPMFLLKPAHGAIGGHQAAVSACYADFAVLANRIAERCDLAAPRSRQAGE